MAFTGSIPASRARSSMCPGFRFNEGDCAVTELIRGIGPAREHLRAMWRSGRAIGSVHTLGALHDGHAKVISLAAEENHYVVVTVYPNKAQFAPGTRYEYDVERDAQFAVGHGATHVIAPPEHEIYPDDYRTFLDQGACYQRLDGTVVPFLFRGMITMSIRWISLVRPTRTYWGLKDIGQALLVTRAVRDLFIDAEVREVPCVRYSSGIPISSRLMRLDRESLSEVAGVYSALERGRKLLATGERRVAVLIDAMRDELNPAAMRHFRECYIKIVEPVDFTEPEQVSLPCVLHIVLTNGIINHFDGLLLRTQKGLAEGPQTIWLDAAWPSPQGDAR